MKILKQSLEYYLNLQYSITIDSDSEGGYVVQVKNLPGCLTQGKTLEETMKNIEEAKELWLETAYEW
jgi:antitoxin HicB